MRRDRHWRGEPPRIPPLPASCDPRQQLAPPRTNLTGWDRPVWSSGLGVRVRIATISPPADEVVLALGAHIGSAHLPVMESTCCLTRRQSTSATTISTTRPGARCRPQRRLTSAAHAGPERVERDRASGRPLSCAGTPRAVRTLAAVCARRTIRAASGPSRRVAAATGLDASSATHRPRHGAERPGPRWTVPSHYHLDLGYAPRSRGCTRPADTVSLDTTARPPIPACTARPALHPRLKSTFLDGFVPDARTSPPPCRVPDGARTGPTRPRPPDRVYASQPRAEPAAHCEPPTRQPPRTAKEKNRTAPSPPPRTSPLALWRSVDHPLGALSARPRRRLTTVSVVTATTSVHRHERHDYILVTSVDLDRTSEQSPACASQHRAHPRPTAATVSRRRDGPTCSWHSASAPARLALWISPSPWARDQSAVLVDVYVGVPTYPTAPPMIKNSTTAAASAETDAAQR